MMGHRRNLYVETLRVPLIVRVPGLAPARVASPVSCVDLLPTLVDLLGLAAPPALEGTSLRSAMSGRPAGSASRSWPRCATPPAGATGTGLIEGRYKLVIDLARSRKLLFDLEARSARAGRPGARASPRSSSA